jgi:two-component system, NtrC family, nitrogen regulation response regulator NtrX
MPMQAKLLRVLEENEIERIGAEKPIAVDVRVVVATHRNLETLVAQGKFRQDLFHRIFVFPLSLPPLRERRDDIPGLVSHFVRQVSAQNGWKEAPFTPQAIAALQNYSWPGNVRELRNLVERMILLSPDGGVDLACVQAALPGTPASGAAPARITGTLSERVDDFERETILAELKRNQFHVTNTAKALGLERSHLYKKAEQLGIDLQAARKGGEEEGR